MGKIIRKYLKISKNNKNTRKLKNNSYKNQKKSYNKVINLV